MRLERERSDGRKDFWEAEVSKKTLAITSGIVNVRNKKETKTFDSTKEARAALDKLVATKRKAGFSEPVALGGHFLPAPLPVNPALEATLRENPSDAAAAGVYADWLEAQGSPVGAYIALAAALEKTQDARKQAKLGELATQLGLPTPAFATWGTRHGFFQWLRLENTEDWMDAAFDAPAFAAKLFATPLCAALDELRIGILRWDENHEDVPAVIDAAGACAWSKSLARLHLGDVDRNIDMAHHMIGDVGAAISRAFPALRRLQLHSGSQEWRGVGETFGVADLALPQLETLVVETCAMTTERLAALLAAKLPKLVTLELWFGGVDRDANATVDDLAPLLAGKLFPQLVKLGLKNQELGGALIERLAAGKLAARLERLDLSMSTLDATTAPVLAAAAKQFPALKVLDVSDNFLAPADLARLTAAFAHAEVVAGTQGKLANADDAYRFATVAE